ncbi:hypothetical protein A3C86_01195 [Candidatus Kaiserbacteria bacterium RIFCSPHIGHO2_02_FULL_49_16]|uniref:HNH domain-containing protein n=1 Tax=Candidatus Kaiserbacteria bacterium RIFCSPHIGHO2_02_FULL_49_16 TaxID=1798490 RepID=A0A1F6DGF6_9BACT|nr:MAG: hypothetical protein A3C86_01195 [Candidatus Kaiserbacteria bacterium RIFCSPHIGHO2_02_FULL_49_16]
MPYGIPQDIEQRIRRRDKNCVYCHKAMIYPCVGDERYNWATIEHFKENGPFYWAKGLKEEDLAICCFSCNSSRGNKGLLIWFKSKYCIDRNINEQTVAEPVKEYIRRIKK